MGFTQVMIVSLGISGETWDVLSILQTTYPSQWFQTTAYFIATIES